MIKHFKQNHNIAHWPKARVQSESKLFTYRNILNAPNSHSILKILPEVLEKPVDLKNTLIPPQWSG